LDAATGRGTQPQGAPRERAIVEAKEDWAQMLTSKFGLGTEAASDSDELSARIPAA
jgi:hypothetical protein